MRFLLMVLLPLLSLELYGAKVVQQTQVDRSGIVSGTESGMEEDVVVDADAVQKSALVLKPNKTIIISVVGQGVAPVNTTSPAQAYALAKRAAIADGYRLIAEKIKGVEVEGQDLVQNMMVKRSTIRTAVYAMVKNANVVETTFRDGLCEVEMEIRLSYDSFAH